MTAAVLLQFTSSVLTTIYGLGGGGNGTILPTNPTSIAGGNGGLFGAGGGGANALIGASGTGQPGGSGSSGLCIVLEYY